MPSWKKVVVSGSDAKLNSLYLKTSLTGSDAYFTGSLKVTGTSQIIGTTLMSGSLTVSGSFPPGGLSASVLVHGNITHDGYVRFNPVTTNIDTSKSASYIYVSGSTNDLYFSQNGAGYANTTRLRWLEGNLYTGLLHGGLITSASSTTFNISSGSGIVVSLNASKTTDPYPTIKYVKWSNITNQPLIYRTTHIQTFLGIDENGQVVQQSDAFNDGQYNTTITLGTVLHQNKSTINGKITYPNVSYGYKQRTYDFIKAFGPLKLSGYALNTSSSLGLTVGNGTAFSDGRNYEVDPNNPSYITDPGTTVSKIFRYYQSGSSFVQDTNSGLGYTIIDPTKYNNNGTLATVQNKYWTVQRVFWYPNSATKGIVVYYGNAQYDSQAEAISNLGTETFAEVENTKQNAIYLGAIYIREDGTFTDPLTYSIQPAGLFRSVGGTSGGGTVSIARLVDLSDVNAPAPLTGDLIYYNSSTSKWDSGQRPTGNYEITGSFTGSFKGNGSQLTNLTVPYSSVTGKPTLVSGSSQITYSQITGIPTTLISSSTGTDNYVPRFLNGKALENSLIYDNGTNVGIGTTSPSFTLDVNGTGRFTGRLDVGTFTPGAGASAYTIATTGRISAPGGISWRSAANGDSIFTGFGPGGIGTVVYSGNGTVGYFGGYGASADPLQILQYYFNPNSGTASKNALKIEGNINATGTFNGSVTGIYYAPTLVSLTGVAYHRAIETVTGDVILGSTSGNVGLRTTNPQARLDVNGNVIISGSLFQYNKNLDVDTGAVRTVLSVSTGSYRSAFFDYVITKSTNARAGTVFSVWNGSTIEYTETSTQDIGSTEDVSLSVVLTNGNVVLSASTLSNDWSIKSLARML